MVETISILVGINLISWILDPMVMFPRGTIYWAWLEWHSKGE